MTTEEQVTEFLSGLQELATYVKDHPELLAELLEIAAFFLPQYAAILGLIAKFLRVRAKAIAAGGEGE